MIDVTIQTLFTIFLYFMLLALIAVGLYEHWRTNTNGWRLSEETLCRCPDCHLTFIVPRNRESYRCPRCNRLCDVQPQYKL